MFCNQCGRTVPEGAAWCTCGAWLGHHTDALRTGPVPPADDPEDVPRPDLADRIGEDGRLGVGALVVITGSLAGSRFDLVNSTTTIGRHPGSHVLLDDVSVSRHHAEIRRLGPAYVIADCNSFNETYLNGLRVKEILLDNLDELQIGRFTIGFYAPR